MLHKAPGAGRAPDKQRQILQALRRQIARGQSEPGARLPSRASLSQRFRASPVTIQRVMDRLAAEGFIFVDTTRGTFVAHRLPHRTRYALVHPVHPRDQEGRYTLFHRALDVAAEQISHDTERRVDVYHSTEGRLGGPEIERLGHEVAEHRLAGLILCDHPHWLYHQEKLKAPKFYHVALSETTNYPGIVGVLTDQRSFVDRAVQDLIARGRRRIGVLTAWQKGCHLERMLRATLRERGVEPPPYGWQYANPLAVEWAEEAVHGMLAGPAAERPDALIITDDNLVEHGTRGLVAAGVRVPQEIEVVAHCNYPLLPKPAVPVRWLGFDCRAVLTVCLEIIDRQRRGEDMATETHLGVLFEDELARRPHAQSVSP